MAQEFYKKIYSHGAFYKAVFNAAASVSDFMKVKKSKVLSDEFIERIMLSVTEVNGCEVCSVAHTKMALDAGLSTNEIQLVLTGNENIAPSDEVVGVEFARQYALQEGKVTKSEWDRLINYYGKEKARGILAAARIMTAANIHGIAISALKRRLKGDPVEKTGLVYELTIFFSILIYLPIALVHATLKKIISGGKVEGIIT